MREEECLLYGTPTTSYYYAKAKLLELTRRNQGKKARQVMEKQKLYMQGWLNYYGLAEWRKCRLAWEICQS